MTKVTQAFGVIRARDKKCVALYTDVVIAHREAAQRQRVFCETFYVQSAVHIAKGARS